MMHPYPPVMGNVEAVFAGFDAGHYTLPETLTDARRGELALRRELREATQGKADNSAGRLVAAAVSAAASGHLDSRTLMADHRADVEGEAHRKERAKMLGRAHAKAADRLYDMVVRAPALADEVIAEHLRPALTETLLAAAKLAPVLEGRDLSEAGIAAASGPVRTAYLAALPLVARHGAIRRAQCGLAVAVMVEEQSEWFLDTRRWPVFRHHPPQGVRVITSSTFALPGPLDALGRLLWLTHPQARAWLPTNRERVDAWQELLDVMGDPDPDRRIRRYRDADAA